VSASITTLRTRRQPAPAPVLEPVLDPMAYAPPFPADLKAALASLAYAHARAQRLASGAYTTVGQAMQLEGLLNEIIAQATAAKGTL
jgi:hypothetical protein